MIPYLAALALAALSGLPGLFLKKGGAATAAVLMGASSLLALGAAGMLLAGGGGSLALPSAGLISWGLLRLDPVTALFLVPVALLFGSASLYGLGYWDEHRENTRLSRACFGLLAASLILLAAAGHTFTFMLAWEGMAITAFLLVMTEDREADTRRAATIYLVATHVGALFLFGAFGLLAKATGGPVLGPLPPGFAASGAGTAMFLLFLAGFGLKAGLLPFHFWLPPAHAAAPTHVSAVMSGVLIKMGILGLVRLITWVPDPPFWWGGCLVLLGVLSGILGVALALGQHDLKRMLAYHSIENIGIILLGLGLGLIGRSAGNPVLQALGFGGALLHVVNHALFKGLLFLAAGSVVRATGTRNLEALGGLGQRMPRTALAFLTGAWAICGLPPLNGFISEWLIFLAAFTGLGFARRLWFLAALAALALIGALALACFAKAFGSVFQGTPRSAAAAEASECPPSMWLSMGILGGSCLLIGLGPLLLAAPLGRVLSALGGAAPLPELGQLAKLSFLTALGLPLLLLAALLWAWAGGGLARRGLPTWDCGYAEASPRMQYTASSFGDGLLRGMKWILWPSSAEGKAGGLFPRPRRFHSHLPDPVLDRAAEPGLTMVADGLSALRFLQSGHLPIYLLYVLLTLLALFVWMVA